jgi:phage portal protein BeeE
MSILSSLLSRILPSGLFVKNNVLAHTQYYRQRSYWQGNSIYLENVYNKISTDVAMMRSKHIKVTRKNGQPASWEWYEHSPLASVMEVSPNLNDTPIVFWSNVMRTILQDGVAVVVPTYSNGNITGLELASGVSDYRDDTVIVQVGEKIYEVRKENIWLFENPKQNLTTQLGQISNLIDSNLKAISEKLNTSDVSWLKGLLKIPTKAQDGELKKRAEQRVQSIYDVANRGGIGYLEQGEDFMELSRDYTTASESELEFLKMQLYQAFGINENLFTCDYTEEQYRAYYQSVIKVYLRVIREEINRKYFTATARTQGQKLLVYMDMFDVASLKDLNDFAFRQKYSGNMNSNEIREIFGYGSYPGGDVYETNKNAIPIGIGEDE